MCHLLLVDSMTSCPQFLSTTSSENILPSNLLLPTNLVDPERLSESNSQELFKLLTI